MHAPGPASAPLTHVHLLVSPYWISGSALHSRLVARVSNEAAERVVRAKLLALQLEARRGRGVVGLEPLLDGAALVREAIRLYIAFDG
eukprot:scaffold41336_cov60-Phaeocystis_antarctica.AAC.1